jgi:SAM-dependent methyltransferase
MISQVKDIQGSSDKTAILTRIREYMVGPTRFMTLLSCIELGLVDAIAASPGVTAEQLGAATGITAHAAEQMLLLLVKEDFVAFDESSRAYTLAGLADLTSEDYGRVMPWMDMIKTVCLRQLYWLTESVQTRSVVGLRKLYGFDGTLYSATARHEDLRTSWAGMMDQVTAHIDPWFWGSVELPEGARVLDLAGNTGLGAILAYQNNPGKNLRVACFDFPEKEEAALRNFRENGVSEHCSFIGGDVFKGVPQGFDVVLIKHFLDMFDKENVLQILRQVSAALEPGGQVWVLVPIYSEDLRDARSVDILPAYFLGCTMGEGGPQKISVYQEWMEAARFKVTKAIPQDGRTLPPDMIPFHGIICGTKVG